MKDSRPLVSIIIPTYNEEEFLPLCLASISKLVWPESRYEIIVVDNGSDDKTCELAASHNALVLKDETKTIAGLRNLGAGRAAGEIIAFVDADCVVAQDWLVQAEKYFFDRSIVAWGSPPGVPLEATWVQKAWYLLRQKQQPVEKVDWLESMNFFVRKKDFFQVMGFDESLDTCEDVDLSYRLAKKGSIVADQSIQVIHLGEAATLGIFIKKEFWRGTSNFLGVFKHGLSLKEIPSLGVPVYFGLFLPVLIAAMVMKGGGFLLAGMAGLILPGALILLKTRRKKAGGILRIQLVFLFYVYSIVRTFAVIPIKK